MEEDKGEEERIDEGLRKTKCYQKELTLGLPLGDSQKLVGETAKDISDSRNGTNKGNLTNLGNFGQQHQVSISRMIKPCKGMVGEEIGKRSKGLLVYA